MSKRGLELNPPEDLSIFNGLPDELFAHSVFPNLDIYTLISALKTNLLFNRLSENPGIWKAMIDRYFPAMKTIDTQTYNTNPKQLFVQEYQNLTQDIKDRKFHHNRFQVTMKQIMVALNGEMDKINEIDNRELQLFLFGIMLSNGHYEVLSLPQLRLEGPFGDFRPKQTLLESGAMLASMFGNKFVYDRLLKDLISLVKSRSADADLPLIFIDTGMLPALENGRVQMAEHVYEQYIRPQNLTEDEVEEFLNRTFDLFFSPYKHFSVRFLAALPYLCSFRNEVGIRLISIENLFRALYQCIIFGDINNAKYLLTLEDNQHNLIINLDVDLMTRLLQYAAANNQEAVFHYLFQNYAANLNLTDESLTECIIVSARHTTPSYSIVQFIAELQRADGKFIITSNTLINCVYAGVSAGKHDMTNYLLERNGSDIKKLIDKKGLIYSWHDANDSLMMALLLNVIFSSNDAKNNYFIFIQQALSNFKNDAARMFESFSNVKDPTGKPYSLKMELMVDAILMVELKDLQNPTVIAFAKSISEEEFNIIKTFASFYRKPELIEFLNEIRNTQTPLFFSDVTVRDSRPRSGDDTLEPPAKRARMGIL